MEQPSRRSAGSIVGVCAFVLVVSVGGAALAWQLRSDDNESDPEGSDYASVGVPWWDGRAHWAGHSTKMGEVASLTASLDAGVFLHNRRGPSYGNDDEFLAPGHGTLTALFADGTVKALATDVLGVPLADPTGHVVAWTTRAGKGTARVTAYDTAERVVLGTQRLDGENAMLTAVVDDTIYLRSGGELLAWQPREGGGPGVVQLPAGEWSAVVGVAEGGLMIMGEQFRVRWVGEDGTEHRVKRFVGSVSPNGQYVATVAQQGDRRDVREVLSGERIDLGLPEDKQAYEARWAADGTLVVAAVARSDLEDGWDDAFRVSNYACEAPSGECRPLAGGPPAIYHLPVYEDSFYGVLMVWYEGIGS